jgi:hypothetical protein
LATRLTSRRRWSLELEYRVRRLWFQARLEVVPERPAAFRREAAVDQELPVVGQASLVVVALDLPARPPLAAHSAVAVAVRAAAEVEQTRSTQ